jgi:hypothetical membrane protein
MKRNLSFLASVIIVIGYLLFTFLAFMYFPDTFSPLRNWLSDLGNDQINPQGAIFYNLGIILTSVVIVPFFLGLSEWKIPGNKIQKIMLLLTQVFGYLGAFAMFMSAVFPIAFKNAHSFWSALLYILLGTAFTFSLAALRYDPRYPKWLLAFGGLVVIVNLTWSLVINTYPMEWLTITLFLGYVFLLGQETRRKTTCSSSQQGKG